jgi:CRISPR-associated protein Cmr2
MTDSLWQAKLAAWTHDPAEKALVLLRDPAGHERGTVAELQRDIFGAPGLPESLREAVKKADRWAAAADRPQWPRMKADGPYADWTQVRFTERPILIHPLSGEEYDLGKLAEITAAGVKAVSTDHFRQLVIRDATGAVDAHRTALSFWRFGPNTPAADLGALWHCLQVKDFEKLSSLFFTQELTDGDRDHRPRCRASGAGSPATALSGGR